jgi:hypothetical protein
LDGTHILVDGKDQQVSNSCTELGFSITRVGGDGLAVEPVGFGEVNAVKVNFVGIVNVR